MDGQSEKKQCVCEVLFFHPLLNSNAKHMQGIPGSANSFAAGVLGAPTGQGPWQCYLRYHCHFSRAINHSLHALHQQNPTFHDWLFNHPMTDCQDKNEGPWQP